MQVAIVGGGVCGLTCAIALMKTGVDVHVYEASEQFQEIGAGIGIGPNVIEILRRLGLVEDIMSRGDKVHTEWFQYLAGMEGHEVLYQMSLPPGDEPFMVHRAAFMDALVKHIDHSRVHFKKRCTSVMVLSNSKQCINFADGSTVYADVVIGADGIKSVVRGAVTGQDSSDSVTYSNTSCYRGLVPIELVHNAGIRTNLTARPICFVGPGKHIIIFGVNAGKLVNVVAFGDNKNAPPDTWERHAPANPAVSTVSKADLLAEYGGWGSDVIKLLGCIETWSKWMINVVYPPLASYVHDRIALIGDAAHGMQTHLGAGAGQGLEDAYLLAQLLSHPHTSQANVETVLKVYDEVRRPRTQRVWDETYQMGSIVDGFGSNGLSSHGLSQDLAGVWDYVWGHGVDDDLKEVEGRLQESGTFLFSPL